MDALVPLAVGLAPELARWLSDPQAEATIAAVSQAVREATGTADEVAAQHVLARDSQIAAQLRLRLGQIAAAAERSARHLELQRLATQLKDAGGIAPRAAVVLPGPAVPALAASWAAPLVSLVVLASFGGVMAVALTRALPPGSETILNMLLGTMAAMATSVVSYWVGSSAGSAAKTDMLFRASPPSAPTRPG